MDSKNFSEFYPYDIVLKSSVLIDGTLFIREGAGSSLEELIYRDSNRNVYEWEILSFSGIDLPEHLDDLVAWFMKRWEWYVILNRGSFPVRFYRDVTGELVCLRVLFPYDREKGKLFKDSEIRGVKK